MAIKAAVNRRLSELEGFTQVLNNNSSEARILKDEYEKESKRVSEDYDSVGLVNPDAEKLERQKDQYILSEDRVNLSKKEVSKALEMIKKDALKLKEDANTLEVEQEKLKEIKADYSEDMLELYDWNKEEISKIEKERDNALAKINSKRRMAEMLDGNAKSDKLEEIDQDIEEFNKAGYDERISNQKSEFNTRMDSRKAQFDKDTLKQEMRIKNIRDTIDSYEAYKVTYNKYAKEKLPELESKTIESKPVVKIQAELAEEEEQAKLAAEKAEKDRLAAEKAKKERLAAEAEGQIGLKPEAGGQAGSEAGTTNKKTIEPIESKQEFKKLYKKMKNDKKLESWQKITPEDRLRLYETLTNKSKYKELGITTGVISNKARKILKEEGTDLRKDIGNFAKKNPSFHKFSKTIAYADPAYDIVFKNYYQDKQTSLSKNKTAYSSDLKKFSFLKNINTKKSINIERYISAIKDYKEAGNTLDSKQQKIYDEAIVLEEKIVRIKKVSKVYNEEKVSKASLWNKLKYKTSLLLDEPQYRPPQPGSEKNVNKEETLPSLPDNTTQTPSFHEKVKVHVNTEYTVKPEEANTVQTQKIEAQQCTEGKDEPT